MRNKVTIGILLLFLFVKFTAASEGDGTWNIHTLSTASGVTYLSNIEKEIILEINKLRSDPARYAEEYIAPLAKHYNRRILHYPGDQPLITREGVSALHECVRVLKRQKPLPVLKPSYGLTHAANDHAKDQSRTGDTGHTGSDNSSMRNRIEKYGQWQVRIAENIAYGAATARQIVIYLLIDDGVPNRGHRENFLNPDFRVVGVATGNHPQYGFMSVMDLAGGFNSVDK